MTSKIICPKCAASVAPDAVICPNCDYVVDTSFLGDDILNDMARGAAVPGPVTLEVAPVDASASEDAVVVGDISDDAELLFSDNTGSFLTADTQDIVRRIAPATVYVSKSVQEMLKPEAVLGAAPDIEQRRSALSPFELHVLSFVDGQRPVARVRKKSGLSNDDVRIALAMLVDKKAIVLIGFVQKPQAMDLFSDEDEALDGDTIEEAQLPAVALAQAQAHAPDRPQTQRIEKKTSGEWKEPVVDVAPVPQMPSAGSPWQGEATAQRLAEESRTQHEPRVASTAIEPLPLDALRPVPVAQPPVAPPMRAPMSSSASTSSPSLKRPQTTPAATAAPPSMSSMGTPAMPFVPPPGSASSSAASITVGERERKERARSFYDLAHSELQKGNKVRAHMYARLAVDTDPDEPKYQELLKQWAQATRAVQSNEAMLIADADLAERQGNIHKALALLQEAVQKNPKNAVIQNRLGLMLAVKFKQYNKALEHIMTAAELDGDNVAYKNNLGKIIALAEQRGVVVAKRQADRDEQRGLLGKIKKAFD